MSFRLFGLSGQEFDIGELRGMRLGDMLGCFLFACGTNCCPRVRA